MKTVIKVLVKDAVCTPTILDNGEWVDLKAAEDVVLEAPQAGVQYQKNNNKYRDVDFKKEMVSLGVAIKLPTGYEAIVIPRSGTFKKYGVIQSNSVGLIDNSYCGNDDVWKFPILMTEEGKINKGDRICQFRIQLSQKATVWQKIKWLFSSGIKIEYVDSLSDNNRGGFGSTGYK